MELHYEKEGCCGMRFDKHKNKISVILNNTFLKITLTWAMTLLVLNIPKVSIYPLIILIFTYCFYKQVGNMQVENTAKVCATIFACCLLLGNVDLLLSVKKNLIKLIIILLGSYFVFSVILQLIYSKLDEYRNDNKLNIDFNISKKRSFFFIILCWTPYWLAFSPAILTPDSISQIKQVLQLEPLVNHHPVIHTMTIKCLYTIITALGVTSINTVIGIISLIQMIFMAIVFSIITYFIYKKSKSKVLLYISVLFYAIIPFNAYYSITIWKDITHAAVTSILLIIILDYLDGQSLDDKTKYFNLFLIFILGCAFCLYRSNGYYAYILWLIPLSVFTYKHKQITLMIVVVISILVSSYIKGPLYASFGIRNASCFESLSIPAQQIAYVIKNNRQLSSEEYYYLGKIIDLKRVPEIYQPYISDNIKGNCYNEEFFLNHKQQYLKIWFKIGIKYPKDYIIAWINQTRGYWYPNISYWVYAKGVYDNDIGLQNTPLAFRKVIDKISFEKVYGLASFYNVAFYTWILIAMFVYAVFKKMWYTVLSCSLLGGIFISLLLGTPVYAEFRYYYSVIASLPLVLVLPITKTR